MLMIRLFLKRCGDKKLEITGRELAFFAACALAKLRRNNSYDFLDEKCDRQIIEETNMNFLFTVVDSYIHFDPKVREDMISKAERAWEVSHKIAEELGIDEDMKKRLSEDVKKFLADDENVEKLKKLLFEDDKLS